MLHKTLLLLFLLVAVLASCTRDESVTAAVGPAEATGRARPDAAMNPHVGPNLPVVAPEGDDLSGRLVIDGSSTVFPITEAASRAFQRFAPKVEVHLGVSGTGGGFKKFCRGEIDISDASRPIKQSESKRCAEAGVEFVEIPIAFDGLSLVVHRSNHWAECMTLAELHRLWAPESEDEVRSWRQVRPSWPAEPLVLYAPGRDSGTFDYFTRAVVGEEGTARNDFVGSEDDYLLAQEIAGDPRGFGFFGYAYYREYQEQLGLVAVDNGTGCVAPSPDSIADGRYRPLSRPVFLYFSRSALERPEVRAFAEFFLANAEILVDQVKYVPLPPRAYELATDRLARRLPGSVFQGGSQVGMSISSILEIEASTVSSP